MCGGAQPSPGAIAGFNKKYRARGLNLRFVDIAGGGPPYDALKGLLSRRSQRCDLFFLDVDFVG